MKVMENNYLSLDYEFDWNTKYKEKTGNVIITYNLSHLQSQ